ncbi:hypothetical protein ACA30_12290 [Virgibacillus soli]|uniref:Uncharacterized protein n=1 Tax=Lederbergia galactosidilytica TaxID=217031 RepID=A0A0Q9XSI9_9BACI|nr:hypothetical protein ACA29_19250 [Lederbergia galactosidilytica]KRG14337.1 hypothetical protein ACA30_12290 [Virgibacillus soli]OAK75770.1 hypothetical protein ABB05_01055 [Lederbergia galactosidilytica]
MGVFYPKENALFFHSKLKGSLRLKNFHFPPLVLTSSGSKGPKEFFNLSHMAPLAETNDLIF